MRTLLVLAVTACGPTGVKPVDAETAAEAETASADTASETGLDSADTADSADSADTEDSAPTVDTETVDFAWSDGLCQLTLDCAGTIVSDPKTACDFTVTDANGTVAWSGSSGVEIRGRSSAGFPKNQYGLELWDDAQESVSADLLGMGAESDWVLNGAWVDRALFRNKLTFDLFQSIGGEAEYAAESRFCELTLNGSYWGIFLLSERVKADDDRINLDEANLATGEAFVLKLDESGGMIPNNLGYGTWTAISPRQDEIDTDASMAIRQAMAAWFNAATGSAPADPDTGIFAAIDLDSAVDFVIMEEFSKNNDAYFLSVHLWKDLDGKIHFVPWDIDLGYGQPSYNNNESPEEWVLYRPAMISAFTLDPAFQVRLSERWAELRAGELEESAIQARIDGYQETMGDAIDRNFERWPIEDVDFSGYLYEVSSYEEELERVRAWIPLRLAWMDENIDAY